MDKTSFPTPGMIAHYYTLRALARELHGQVCGLTIDEIFTQQKDELVISFEQNSSALCVSINPKLCYVVHRNRIARAKKNSVDLFHDLAGMTMEEISIYENDRMLVLKFQGHWTLLLQLFNSAASNVMLVDEQNTICTAFKNNKELKGQRFQFPEDRSRLHDIGDWKSFHDAIMKLSSRPIVEALKLLLPVLGSTYVREILFRTGTPPLTHTEEIDENTMMRIFQGVRHLLAEALRPRPIVYWTKDDKRVLSILPLKQYVSLKSETYPSVNEAIQACLHQTFRENIIADEKGILIAKVRKELNKSRLARAKAGKQNDEAKEPVVFEHLGNLLLSHLSEISRGARHVVIHDPEGGTVLDDVPLDPLLSPVQNAERFFEKSKKAKQAHKELVKRLHELDARVLSIENLERQLESCLSANEVREFKKKHREELRRMNIVSETPGEEQPPFRIFVIAGGFQVWVGKSSANNDLLTMKYAKPNDLWFHVRGASGSHTVLKVPNTASPPSREAIAQAASIAAYYSKMRKAGNVPVAYCQRKYVRKPKGVNEGAVLMEREKVIFVKPGLP